MLTPKEIIDALDKYIIGQDDAKRAVAIALRNRYRWGRLSDEMREEITPKNIIMVGPTGVGKTEIARRLAKLVDAPFAKVEATKFTEVGYVGRDVDSMIRDLIEASINLCKKRREAAVKHVAEAAAEQRLCDLLMTPSNEQRTSKPMQNNPLQFLFDGAGVKPDTTEIAVPKSDEERTAENAKRSEILSKLRDGRLEDTLIEISVNQDMSSRDGGMLAIGIDFNLNEVLGDMLPKQKKLRKMSVKDARRIIIQEEMDKLIDMDEVIREAVEKAEQDGIIFIDEIDKIVGAREVGHGPDVSREGVQRDILPLVEGCTVSTKYGGVKTDHILFIAAGAFHVSKLSDMIPELQGRFPIIVELNALTAGDFKQILTKPKNSLTKQYAALLSVDNISLSFTDGALDAISEYALMMNETNENIGARRLHTIMEKLLEDISFNANGNHPQIEVVIDEKYVKEHIDSSALKVDLQKFII